MDDAFQRLSRRMWQRAPGQRLWFWFSPDQAPHLILEPVTARGTQAFAAQVAALSSRDGARQQAGVVFVGERSQCVFCAPSLPRQFLAALAGWVTENIAQTPALLGLKGAGMARLAVTPGDMAALPAPPAPEAVRVQPELWTGLMPATIAAPAATLERHLPGERLWFWLWPEATADTPMLLLSACAEDPTLEQIRHQAQQHGGYSAAEAVTGSAILLGDGRLQLVGTRAPTAALLPALAQWVTAHVGAHPALARLRGCAYAHLDADSGEIRHVYEDEALWQDLSAPRVPGSLEEAAAHLEALPPGATARFWSTTHKPPFISILSVEDDPDGAAFAVRVQHLQSRAGQAGVAGILQRLPSGRLLLSSPSARCAEAAPILARLAGHPGLGALAGAHLSHLSGGRFLSTTTVSR